MNEDFERRISLEHALASEPDLAGVQIAVVVSGTEAMLSGEVRRYAQKLRACKTARSFAGIKNVTDRIRVVPDPSFLVNDDTLLALIRKTLRKQLGFASDALTLQVRKGVVSIIGQLRWKYQRDLILEAVADVDNVIDIQLHIEVPETMQKSISKSEITDVISCAEVSGLHVEIVGNKVIVNGLVSSDAHKAEVTRKLKSVPGVAEVENLLYLQPANS